jgi:hypothetical protein
MSETRSPSSIAYFIKCAERDAALGFKMEFVFSQVVVTYRG